MQSKPAMSDVALIVNAMSIYKGTWWDPKKGVMLEWFIMVQSCL